MCCFSKYSENLLSLKGMNLTYFRQFHIENSYLLFNGNLMAGFYVKYNAGFKLVNECFTKMRIFWDPENIYLAVFAILISSQSAFTCPNYNNRNTRTRCAICLKLTIKTPEQCHWRCSGVFNVTFEYISHVALVFPLLTLNM